MRSRFLVGAAAWLLGGITATTASTIAVNELAHGLLDQQTQQLGGSAINADLAAGRGSAGHASTGNQSSANQRLPGAKAAPSPSRSDGSAGQPQNSAGTLLESGDGSVLADCHSGAAYLLYWSPDQGFRAEDVYRGPSAVASVAFTSPDSSVVMRVTCRAGVPTAHLYRPSPEPNDDNSPDT